MLQENIQWRSGVAFGVIALGLWLAAVGQAESPGATPQAPSAKAGAVATGTPRLNAKQRKILERLVGKWKLEDAEDELEFRRDGSFLGKSHTVEMTAKYEVSPEGKLIIDLGLPAPPKRTTPGAGEVEGNATPTSRTLRVVREVSFEGKKLVLRDRESGQVFRYVRLR